MALNIVDTSYSGTYASYLILPATFGMETIEKGAVWVEDGIKKLHTIDRMDFTNPLQPRVATPTSSGTFTQDGRTLTPKDLMMYVEFNPRDYESNFLAEQLSNTLLTRELPPTAETYMMKIGLERVMEQVETGLWIGSTTYTATPGTSGNGQICFFDGFLKKMLADSTVWQVASPVTLTASNILAAMTSCMTLLATNKKALLSRAKRFDRLKFFMSVNTNQIYQAALTEGLTFKGVNTMERGDDKPYKGYQVVTLAGMPDNTILFCEGLMDTSSNLWVGMNSMEDTNLELARLQNNSELFFLKALMKYDVNYGWGNEIALYTTLTSASFNV
jgi:hypothetical protein